MREKIIILTFICMACFLGLLNPAGAATRVLERDGVYVVYTNGIVKDTKTGLEWKVGPDKSMDWYEARSWVQSLTLDGGGWRMPTTDELKTLYKPGVGFRNMTPLLKIPGELCVLVWSGEIKKHWWGGKSGTGAWAFSFYDGSRWWWAYRDYAPTRRAFAVRSRSDG